MSVGLRSYTIFERPADHPQVPFVVRGFTITAGQVVPDAEPLGFAATLDAARALVPPEADACLPRGDVDAPQVVETWL